MAVVRVSTEALSNQHYDREKYLMLRCWRRASRERETYRGREFVGAKIVR